MPFTDFKPHPKEDRCIHPEHDPPGMIVLEPGTHTYECPGCGAKQTFTVPPRPTCNFRQEDLFPKDFTSMTTATAKPGDFTLGAGPLPGNPAG